MSMKPYIALFFALVFLGKFFLFDANAMEMAFGEKVTFVNPFCKKKQTKTNHTPLEFEEAVSVLVVAVSSFCKTSFQLETSPAVPVAVSHNYQTFSYLPQAVAPPVTDIHGPPPQV